MAVKYPRDAGFRPGASDNRLNAWYSEVHYQGRNVGRLAGAGAFPIELTLDHTRPVARTAGDAARLLEVLAGADASTRANRRDCVRRPIPSSSPETNALTTRSTPYRMKKSPKLVRQISHGPLELEA